jgi:hypothetical protein
MGITPHLEQKLRDLGYENHCFVSYPRIRNQDGEVDFAHPINQCALRVKEAIERRLAFSIPPHVFMDTGMRPAVDWEPTLKRALCKSLVMVAVCAGIYYHPSHRWCGLEWAWMDALGSRRLRGSGFGTIVPLMIKVESSLPETVLRPQRIDISRAWVQGPRYYSTNKFREYVGQIVAHIENVADAVTQSQARTDCRAFDFPQESAFAGWEPAGQAFPFRNEGGEA